MTPRPDVDQLAEQPLDELDAAILDAIRAVYTVTDPMPEGLTDRVKFELTLAALHAEVAELSDLAPVGVRDDTLRYTPTESVTFTSSTVSLMVTFGPAAEGSSPDRLRVDGWITGAVASVELRIDHVSYTATPDEHGRFVIEDLPHGSAWFVLMPASAEDRPVITPKIEV